LPGLWFFNPDRNWVVTLALVIGISVNNTQTSGKILNGVSMAGVNLGGLTPRQAEAVIGRQIQFPLSGKITFTFGEKSWSATPAELGLYLDTASSAAIAMQQGRSGGFLHRYWRR